MNYMFSKGYKYINRNCITITASNWSHCFKSLPPHIRVQSPNRRRHSSLKYKYICGASPSFLVASVHAEIKSKLFLGLKTLYYLISECWSDFLISISSNRTQISIKNRFSSSGFLNMSVPQDYVACIQSLSLLFDTCLTHTDHFYYLWKCQAYFHLNSLLLYLLVLCLELLNW